MILATAAAAQSPSESTTAELDVLAADGGFYVEEPGRALIPPALTQDSPARYPDAARARNVGGSVELELRISTAGEVADVTVTRSLEPELDAAAVKAARGLRFRPALIAGEPAEVRLRFTYSFQPPPPAPGTLAGEIRARGTRRPIAGAALVEGTVLIATAGTDGTFSVALPPGRHALTIRAPGHAELHVEETVAAGETVQVVYRLASTTVAPYESVVRGERPRAEVSRHSLRGAELTEVPGTLGEPFRVVMLLPGVSSMASGISYPVVRGAQPAATGYFVDGVQVPVLFHVALGPAVVHPDFLEGIDFYPGTAPLRYGRLLGGVVDGQVSRPREDRARATAYLDLINAGGLIEAPLERTGTTFTLSGRYSYTGWLVQSLAGVLASGAGSADPQLAFWDYQGRIEQRLPSGGSLRLLALGSSDSLGMAFDSPHGVDSSLRLLFHRIDLRLRQPLAIGSLEAGVTWGHDETGLHAQNETGKFAVASGASSILLDYALATNRVAARAAWTLQPLPALEVTFGGDVEHQRARNTLSVETASPEAGSTGAPELTLATLSGVYAEARWTDGEGTTLVGGVRGDAWHLVPALTRFSLDPRLTVRRHLAEGLVLSGSAGIVHQPPTVLLNVPVFDISGLRFLLQEAWQFELGAEWKPAEAFEVSLSVYYSHLQHVLELDLLQLLENRRALGQFAPLLETTGRAYGLEVMLKHHLGGRWFGWISYALQRATRQETFLRFDDSNRAIGEVTGDVPFAFDQTHVLNAAVSYRFPGDITAGATLHFNTGRPESGRISSRTMRAWRDPDRQRDTWRYVSLDEVDRLPPFFRVDLRVAKTWTFDDFRLEAYLDILNASLQRETLYFDYCDAGAICSNGRSLAQEKIPVGFPVVVPMLGLKGSY